MKHKSRKYISTLQLDGVKVMFLVSINGSCCLSAAK